MRSILIAFDGSPSARSAIERTAALLPSADAVIVTVAAGLDDLDEVGAAARVALSDDVIHEALGRLRESALAEAEATARAGGELATAAGLRATTEVVTAEGSPWPALAAAARRLGVDAIACGVHGHGAVARAIVGSVSSGLIRHADVPVLVVPERAATPDGPVLVAFDNSDPAIAAVTATAPLLADRRALVLRVWQSPVRHRIAGRAFAHAPLRNVRETVQELDDICEQWAAEDAAAGARLATEHGLPADARAVESEAPPATVILDAARELDAGVIVVGRRGRGAVTSALLGSVSSSILHAADRPVLVA